MLKIFKGNKSSLCTKKRDVYTSYNHISKRVDWSETITTTKITHMNESQNKRLVQRKTNEESEEKKRK